MAKANVNLVETGSENEVEYCLTLESLNESEILTIHAASDHEYAREMFATIHVSHGNSTMDSGATCSLLSGYQCALWRY